MKYIIINTKRAMGEREAFLPTRRPGDMTCLEVTDLCICPFCDLSAPIKEVHHAHSTHSSVPSLHGPEVGIWLHRANLLLFSESGISAQKSLFIDAGHSN